MYDLLPIDDLERYKALADVTVHNRFQPHTKGDGVQLALTTFTRLPAATSCPVVLVGTALEVVQHLEAPVYRAPHWSSHAVVGWALSEVWRRSEPGRPLHVAGRGQIAETARRWWRRYARESGLTDDPRQAGAVIVATPATEVPGVALLNGDRMVLVSVTRRPWPWALVEWALDTGHALEAVFDVPPRGWHARPGLAISGHMAWAGHRAAERRQRVVEQVLRLATEGRLDELPRVRTRAAA
jgi:hypothetical protein